MRSTTYRSIKVHLKLQCSQFLGQVQFCAVGNQELVRRYGCVRSLQGYQDGHIVVALPSIIAVDIMHCNLWQLVLVQLPLYAEQCFLLLTLLEKGGGVAIISSNSTLNVHFMLLLYIAVHC
jgi:hypothetical protein